MAGLDLTEPAEVFQAHLMVSYLVTQTIGDPGFSPGLLRSLRVPPGAPHGVPPWSGGLSLPEPLVEELRREAHAGETVGFDGLSYSRAGAEADRLHRALAQEGGVPERHGDRLVPFGTPYFFRSHAGLRSCLQVHKLCATPSTVYPVVTVTALIERKGCSPGEGIGYFIDTRGNRVSMDAEPGDIWALHASGSPYGRTPVEGSGFVVSLTMSYALENRQYPVHGNEDNPPWT